MDLLIVNPNSTAAMTEKVAAAARLVARPETRITATNPAGGPPAIQGYLDGALCLPGMLAEIEAHSGADAVIIACFDDTGLDAARALARGPVLGIGEAAYHAASLIATRFSVVTTLSRSVPVLEGNLLRYGLDRRCVSVRASDVPVLELERGEAGALGRIRAQIRLALEEDGAEAIVLGCAGMVDLVARLADEFSVPVVEGASAAVGLAEALVTAGLTTSRAGAYVHDAAGVPPGACCEA